VGIRQVEPRDPEEVAAALRRRANRRFGEPFDFSSRAASSKLVPARRVRAPSFVAITTSSVMPRERRQRPSKASLSPPWLPVSQKRVVAGGIDERLLRASFSSLI
jgi:hypothetical protein